MAVRRIDLLQGTLDLLILKSLGAGRIMDTASRCASTSCRTMC